MAPLSLLLAMAAAVMSCEAFQLKSTLIRHREPGLKPSVFAAPSDVAADGSDADAQSLTRRQLALCAGFLGLLPDKSLAAPATDSGEAIRRAAANIPGYGQADVFYPSTFSGKWKVTRDAELYRPDGSVSTNLSLSYSMRFLSSIEDESVIADRGANQAELEEAIQREIAKAKSSTETNDSKWVQSFTWAYNNPNDLRLQFADGSRKEIKVTKRATERTDTTVSSSEFQRITQEDATRGIPVLSARRVMTRWKFNEDDGSIEGLELVYNVGAPGGSNDPMNYSIQQQQQPTLLSKSRLRLTLQK